MEVMFPAKRILDVETCALDKCFRISRTMDGGLGICCSFWARLLISWFHNIIIYKECIVNNGS